ncbi:MAG: type II secretion system F family protein [Ilumatobacteraceae bacterium]
MNPLTRSSLAWRARRRCRNLRIDHDHNLEEAVRALGHHLASGSSLTAAIRLAQASHPTSTLGHVAAAVEGGSTVAEACHHATRSGDEASDGSLALMVIALAAEHGGDPVAHIEALETTLRERRHARDERRSQASTALASARFLTILPIVCSVWICLDDPSVRDVLLNSPIGYACLTIGVFLNVIGRRWVTRLVLFT